LKTLTSRESTATPFSGASDLRFQHLSDGYKVEFEGGKSHNPKHANITHGTGGGNKKILTLKWGH